MKKFVLDTNALLRFLLNDIPAQKNEVRKLLVEARNGKILLSIPSIVIFEINFVLTTHYHQTKDEIIEKLESLVALPYLDIQSKTIFGITIDLYKRTSVSFVDCFLFAEAENQEAELFTFDKKLKNLK